MRDLHEHGTTCTPVLASVLAVPRLTLMQLEPIVPVGKPGSSPVIAIVLADGRRVPEHPAIEDRAVLLVRSIGNL